MGFPFFWWGLLRGGFCGKLPEVSPMSNRPNARWIIDGPAVGRAEPISDSESASGITDLRRGKIYRAGAIADRDKWNKNTGEKHS